MIPTRIALFAISVLFICVSRASRRGIMHPPIRLIGLMFDTPTGGPTTEFALIRSCVSKVQTCSCSAFTTKTDWRSVSGASLLRTLRSSNNAVVYKTVSNSRSTEKLIISAHYNSKIRSCLNGPIRSADAGKNTSIF